MEFEIERKFLVKEKPSLENVDYKEITQAYLNYDPEIRIRSINNNEFYLTRKGNGDLIREEDEPTIDKNSFYELMEQVISKKIVKTRYIIDIGNNLKAELDIYHNELEGLMTVETEFTSIEEANEFVPPIWYGEEVTADKRYKNKNLARVSNKDILKLIKYRNES